MKLTPVHERPRADYPQYTDYQADRRRLLGWLAAGGATVVAGALVGCDRVRQTLGLQPPPPPMPGEIACPTQPTPTPPTGEGEGTDGVEPIEVPPDDARPEAHIKGDMAEPDPVESGERTEDTSSTTSSGSDDDDGGGKTDGGGGKTDGGGGGGKTDGDRDDTSATPDGHMRGKIRQPGS